MIDNINEHIAIAIHEYDRAANNLGEIPSWSKLKENEKDKYRNFAFVALDEIERLAS